MGIVLKDQKVLYGDLNLGQIDVDTPVDPVIPTDIPVTAITLLVSNNGVLAATQGSTLQITAVVSPSNASNKSVTWSSSNTAIATVSSNGLVTRTASVENATGDPGSVTITCTSTSTGVSASATLLVSYNKSSSGDDDQPTLTLPGDAFAVFEGDVQPQNGEWEDQSGNGNDAEMGGASDYQGTVWDTDHLVCAVDNCVSGIIDNGGFEPSKGMTFNAYVEYNAAATGYTNDTSKSLDILFAIGGSSDTDKMQLGISARGSSSDSYSSKLFAAIKDNTSQGSSFITKYGNASPGSGKHLLTWSIVRGNVTVEGQTVAGQIVTLYVDGMKINQEIELPLQKTDDGSNIGILAAGKITDVSSRIYNFFGNVYGLSIYNKVLKDSEDEGTDEIGQCLLYYESKYGNSGT